MRTLLLTVAATALLAAPASAVTPDQTFELGGAATFEWQGTDTTAMNISGEAGSAGGSAVCGKTPADYCEYVLLKIAKTGTYTITFEMDSSSTDIDPVLFASDASATKGEVVNDPAGSVGDAETMGFDADAGSFYLVESAYWSAQNTSYVAKVAFEAAAPLDPVVAAPAANKAPEAKARIAKSVKAKKLKAFRGSAADADGTVAKVEIGLVQVNRSSCRQLGARGRFSRAPKCEPTRFLAAKGTSAWSFKLAKKLKKGRYILFVRAVDDKGTAQAGFTKANKVAFRVR